jgi:hypothetical protein
MTSFIFPEGYRRDGSHTPDTTVSCKNAAITSPTTTSGHSIDLSEAHDDNALHCADPRDST